MMVIDTTIECFFHVVDPKVIRQIKQCHIALNYFIERNHSNVRCLKTRYRRHTFTWKEEEALLSKIIII